MLGRSLAAVAVVFALGACGSRTPLRIDDDGALDEAGQAGAAGTRSGDGGRGGDGGGAGFGSGGRSGSGAGGHAGDNSAGDGSAGDGSAGSSAGGGGGFGAGGSGAGGFSGAGAGGVSGSSGGVGGVGGRPIGAGEGGASGMAGEILNPQDCDTPHPFVLSIDPAGSSGSVRGWLESTAGLVFEDQLPRFVRGFLPNPASERAIALWWSIGGVGGNGEGNLYFYAGDFTSTTSEVAVAFGARRFADIDVDALDFAFQTVEARTGSFIVYRNALTGEAVALRVDQIFITDPAGDALCAAVDASWRFLR